MYRRKDSQLGGHAAFSRGIRRRGGLALVGLFSQVSGALSCWAACESEGLLPETAEVLCAECPEAPTP